MKTLLFFCAYGTILVSCVVNPGPKYPPTKGEIWPKPQNENKEQHFYTFDPSNFKVEVTGKTCDLLTRAINRYSYLFTQYNRLTRYHINSTRKHRKHRDVNYKGRLEQLAVQLNEPCEDYPHFEMDESYNLTVAETSKLESSSIWGILRGLESLAQLFYISGNGNELCINATMISDYPRFAYRGLLLDTSRHFISLHNILTMLDGMVMNKMNVFHWHIVDDQSFPYESEKFPELSRRGAYHPSMVYTKDDVKEVIQYARDRGIRVIPEFDVPGHTRSWGAAYPHILAECYEGGKIIGLGPMDPIRNFTYKIISELFQEVQQRFPDKSFHIGGDEVELSCWSSNPELQKYIKENNMTVEGLHALFMRKVIPLLANGTQPIVWQEVFDEGVPLSNDTLIHVWKWGWIDELVKVLNEGHLAIFSSEWYLDHLDYEFDKLYVADPQKAVRGRLKTKTLENNIVGGEACMWGEMIDDRNVLSRVWPRGSAVAERLWSAELSESLVLRERVINEARHRIEEHSCRMNQRGIPAAPPLGPGVCVV